MQYNGELYRIVSHLGVVQNLIEKGDGLLSYDTYIRPLKQLEHFLIKTLHDSRMGGCNWIYENKDIEFDKEDGNYRLPSAEFWFFLPEGKSHNDFPDIWKEIVVSDKGIIWDTEHSAIYPRFETHEDAKLFIKQLDLLIDKFIGLERFVDKKPWEIH